MKNDFAKKIKELREKHFEGQSLRSVALLLEKKFGKNFFTYLSKIENGALPSTKVLSDIAGAYKLSQSEYKELLEVYAYGRLRDEIEPTAMKHGIGLSESPVLFRKTKKKK